MTTSIEPSSCDERSNRLHDEQTAKNRTLSRNKASSAKKLLRRRRGPGTLRLLSLAPQLRNLVDKIKRGLPAEITLHRQEPGRR